MAITLIRSSYEPDNSADVGQHQFTYAMYPHESGWREANSERKALELNQPLGVAISRVKEDSGNKSGGKAVSIPEFSAFRLEEWNAEGWEPCSHVIATAFKSKQLDTSSAGQRNWVVRLVETQGRKSPIRLIVEFKVKAAEELNLLEAPLQAWPGRIEGNQLVIEEIMPYEIRTFLISELI